MPCERDSNRIVIAGASSLLGAELKSLLEESRFAASDFRLLDEELAAGTLTEAGGEPAVIRPVEEDSFDRARFVFFTGSIEFTRANFALAQRSGAVIIDLSGHPRRCLIPCRGSGAREASRPGPSGKAAPRNHPLGPFRGAHSPCTVLARPGLAQLTATVLQPVSAWGKPGIEELETQSSQLLSFQAPGKPLFDAQVAFSTLGRFGPRRCFDLPAAGQSALGGTLLPPGISGGSRDSACARSCILCEHIFRLRRDGQLCRCGPHPKHLQGSRILRDAGAGQP